MNKIKSVRRKIYQGTLEDKDVPRICGHEGYAWAIPKGEKRRTGWLIKIPCVLFIQLWYKNKKILVDLNQQ